MQISPGIIELILLLLDLPVNFLSNLSKFKLGSQYLILFLLKGCFCFFQCSLKFLLFNFQPSALLVKFMDWSSPISKLVKEILNFISQILVFSLHNIQLFNGFIPSSLQAEELTVVITAFLLAGINFSSQIINLGFPLSNNLKWCQKF